MFFIYALYFLALFLLSLTTAKAFIVNKNTFDFIKMKGLDPNVAHPDLAIRGLSFNFMIFNWLIASAVGNYLFG